MPEGAEVKIISEQLHQRMAGKRLVAIDVISGRYKRNELPGLSSLITKLPLIVNHVDCKGKFIFFVLEDASAKEQISIWNTLGMTGHWATEEKRHARISWRMDDASFFFCDPRNFGTMHCDMSLSALNKKLSSLGLDLLKQEHSLASFKRQVQRRKSKTIVEALMDQSITAGVGNYVKCEALWRSRISPFRVVATLSDTELTLLMESIRAVLLAAYHAHGHTMSDFVDLDGEKGQYSFKLSVYGHAHDILGNPVRRDETPDGRTTYWVPEMQR